MAVQFRQIGVPDQRKTTAGVLQQLKRAQQRTETLLNRPQFPRPPVLLATLKSLQKIIMQAYAALPLQRLTQMHQRLDELRDDVDRSAYFGMVTDPAITAKILRRFYSDVTGLMVNLQEPKQVREPEPDQLLDKFLKTAEQRGWKVPPTKQPRRVKQDGFVQSVDYLHKIAVTPHDLLDPEQSVGTTEGAIVLMTEHRIPESTLKLWADQRDVYIVFGHYVVLPKVQLFGMLPHLVLADQRVNLKKFTSATEMLWRDPDSPQLSSLIHYPRRVQHHYYCPVVNVAGQDRHYFKTWDLLIQPSR